MPSLCLRGASASGKKTVAAAVELHFHQHDVVIILRSPSRRGLTFRGFPSCLRQANGGQKAAPAVARAGQMAGPSLGRETGIGGGGANPVTKRDYRGGRQPRRGVAAWPPLPNPPPPPPSAALISCR
ncbi:unnamed protein product [Arctogadus glacialis]